MQNKIKKTLFMFVALMGVMIAPSFAEITDGYEMDDLSAVAIAEYDVSGSLFEQITNLEQEKVLMQLEKERAQLDLELDRLAAEKIKLHMEIDTLSGRAEEQQAVLETERAKLQAEAARLEREKQQIMSGEATPATSTRRATNTRAVVEPEMEIEEDAIVKKYRLVDIIGAGKQLQATVENINNGQRKKVSVGKLLDDYTVRSISLDDGVVFTKDGKSEILNIGKSDK